MPVKLLFRAFSKIYTRTGDKGTTFLNVQTGRIPKSSKIFDLLGDTDELSSSLSVAKEHCKGIGNVPETITIIQHRLQDINSILALSSPSSNPIVENLCRVLSEESTNLEIKIDELTESLNPLRNFIIPSGGLAASHLHLARAVCRRTERTMCAFYSDLNDLENEKGCTVTLMFINRLSDYLFTVARYCAKIQGYPETLYSSRKAQK